MERAMLDRAERDAVRRAKRERYEGMVPPELYEAELGATGRDSVSLADAQMLVSTDSSCSRAKV